MIRDRRVYAMLGVMLAMLLSALDQTIVATALPQVVRELHGLEHLSWVFTSYMLAATVTVPIYGKLSDVFGRRTFFLLGIGVFLAASVLSGQARSMPQLILFRGLQGIGGGAIMVNAMAVIGDLFEPAERGRWQGWIGGVFGLASVGGPLLGGWLTDHLSWRWIFYVNLPLGLLASAVIAATLPKVGRHRRDRPIDVAGALTLAVGLVCLLLALVWGGTVYPWGSRRILTLLAGAAVALGAFVAIEARAAEAILPLDLFKSRAFVVSVLVSFLIAIGMFGAVAFLPLFAQNVTGFSATNSGLVLAPMMVGLIVASAVSGQIMTRTGRYKPLAIGGAFLSLLGMFGLSRLSIQTTQGILVLDMVVLGLGLGMSFPIFTLLVQNAFPHARLGVVTAAMQLFRSIGGTVGLALMGSTLNHALAARLAPLAGRPMLARMERMIPHTPGATTLDAPALQALLAPAAQARLHEMVTRAPLAARESLEAQVTSTIHLVRVALAGSIADVYRLAVWLMVPALLASFLLPAIRLRRSNRSAIEEMGMELDAEFAYGEPEDEPDLAPDDEESLAEAEALDVHGRERH